MKPSNPRRASLNRRIVFVCGALLSLSPVLLAQQTAQDMTDTSSAPAEQAARKIPHDQLDSLVAPIALYPDSLLAQILAASTYPLEIVELEQWLKRNPNLKDQALAEAVARQPWDPSVQAMAVFPDVVTRLSANVAWATNLGNAFLAQQQDVMDAIQRMRAKAQGTGALKTTEQQTVETQAVEGGGEAIEIQPANSQYVYVPSYDPEVVYGEPGIYPYPAYYYPGYAPGMGLAFGTGVILGAAWANNWGNCNWGHGDITINNKNNFNKNNINNINKGGNRTNIGNQPGAGGAGTKWQHDAQHRGGAPYGDRNTANKYGGRARQQTTGAAKPGGGAGFVGGAGNRPGGGGNIGSGNRPGGGLGAGGAGNRPGSGTGSGAGAGAGNRGGANAGTRPSTGMSSGIGGGGNSIGNRSVSAGSGFGSSSNAFGGAGAGFGGSSARSASGRGGQSMGGGGFSGGGGRAGGGGRGGGGGRR